MFTRGYRQFGGLHHHLRQATKQLQRIIDHHPVLAPLLRPDLTRVQYGHALEALHSVQATAQAAILEFLARHPGLFDYASRRKLPALESDLAALGRAPALFAANLPALESVSALVGLLYTIEGSAQGGQHIARLVHRQASADLPTAFFDSYGPLSRQRWDEFLQFADAVCTQQEWESTADAATATFEAIRRHLDTCRGRLAASPCAACSEGLYQVKTVNVSM